MRNPGGVEGRCQWRRNPSVCGTVTDGRFCSIVVLCILHKSPISLILPAHINPPPGAPFPNFSLTIDDSNLYHFEGVDYSKTPTKGIYVSGLAGATPDPDPRPRMDVLPPRRAPPMLPLFKQIGPHTPSRRAPGAGGPTRARWRFNHSVGVRQPNLFPFHSCCQSRSPSKCDRRLQVSPARMTPGSPRANINVTEEDVRAAFEPFGELRKVVVSPAHVPPRPAPRTGTSPTGIQAPKPPQHSGVSPCPHVSVSSPWMLVPEPGGAC